MNKKRLLATALAILFLACAWQAAFSQTLVSVTPTTVTYDTGVREATISRDILANLPLAGEYQWTADDLALIAPVNPFDVPPFLPDSLLSAIDSLNAAIAEAEAAMQDQAALEDSLSAALDSLEAALEDADQARQAQANQITSLQSQVQSLSETNDDLSARNAQLQAHVSAAIEAVHRAITLVTSWVAR